MLIRIFHSFLNRSITIIMDYSQKRSLLVIKLFFKKKENNFTHQNEVDIKITDNF